MANAIMDLNSVHVAPLLKLDALSCVHQIYRY